MSPAGVSKPDANNPFKIIMQKFCVAIIASGLFAFAASAQVTNVTFTELESFEAQPGTVVVAGAGQVGSMAIGDITVSVFSRESTAVNSGRKEYGAVVELGENDRREARMFVDYDEMD